MNRQLPLAAIFSHDADSLSFNKLPLHAFPPHAIFSPFGWHTDVRPEETTEGDALNDQRSVLIVDRSQETREVLREALGRRGLRTLQAGRAEKGLELARQHRPDLIVLDLDLDAAAAEQFSAIPCDANCDAGGTPAPQSPPYEPQLVLLGSLRRLGHRLPGGEFVAKPYHYGPLIRKIEELLVLRRV
jgi:hypothetical protein